MPAYTKTSSKRFRIDLSQANALFANQPDVRTIYHYPNYGRTLKGNYLPKWRDIIRTGGMATTNLWASIDDLEIRNPNMYASYYWKQTPSSTVGYIRHDHLSDVNYNYNLNPIALFSILTNAFYTVAKNRAIQSLYREIHKAHHQVQGGVILGELGKTARMLAKTAKGLKSGVINYIGSAVGIRRGKGSTTSKQKAISRSYLEAVFGWQPLINDCKDAAKAIGRLVHESDRARFRAFGDNVGQAAQVVSVTSYSHLYVNVNQIDKAGVEIIYRGFLRGPKYEAGSPPAERIVSMAGFDLRSFLPTVWELIPYSFLVDYFTNIGDVLQALSVDTSGVYGLWKTERYWSTRAINCAPDFSRSRSLIPEVYKTAGEFASDVSVSGTSGGYTIKRREVARDVSGMPLMVPQFTGFDLPWKQFANIGALLSSKMS